MNTQEANQKVFDDALAHIREQGCASYDPKGAGCSYRTADGRSCAFAPQIAEYVPEMEGKNVIGLRQRRIGLIDNLTEAGRLCDIDVGYAVQDCHDAVAADIYKDEFLEKFEEKMRMVAERFDLEYKEAV